MPDDFHEQTKFVGEPRKRHGLPWAAVELATLKELYHAGTPLREICDRMERPKEGVLPKLVQLGLIRRVADGYRYVYRRKVLPDAYKVSLPKRDIHSGVPVYPYIAAMIDSLDAGIFKDAASGVTTCADLSGLGLQVATPSHQTQPKETTMKIETKVFINDQDASNLTDEQIFAEIRRAEKRIEELKAIKVQSGKLAKAIDDLQDYVNKLAAYVDER